MWFTKKKKKRYGVALETKCLFCHVSQWNGSCLAKTRCVIQCGYQESRKAMIGLY